MRSPKYMRMGSKPKKLKKATQAHQRLEQAKVKTVLATVAAMCQGCAMQARDNLDGLTAREQDQISRILKWSDECLDHIALGKKAVLKATTDHIPNIGKMIDQHVPLSARKGLGQYVVIWLILGYLADAARDRYAPVAQLRQWRYLASVVNTWAAMVMRHESKPAYEEAGGVLAEKVERYLLK